MELTEDSKYRLAYLALRLIFDAKLSKGDPSASPGILKFLDLLAGTQLAGEASGKHYASQREKIESFIDAEYDDEVLEIVRRTAAELT
ncbi:MAG TPA: hypothetical protein VNO26_16490 [Candidatus Limnocylindria bacterium]|nr:hypothetical protein [Candidatus Limnocylindria bacterium]